VTEPYLMLIDLQRVFGERDSPWFTPGFADAAAGCRRLRDGFAGRTALTRFVPPALAEDAWGPYYELWPFALDPANAAQFNLVPDFPATNSVIIDRPTFGKWDAETDRAIGRTRELVLAGVSTDCCVIATALAAADAGVHVQVVGDACAGLSDTDHQRALDAMALFAPMIEITTVAEVLAGGMRSGTNFAMSGRAKIQDQA
jgi:nicotinamidase-related amidase